MLFLLEAFDKGGIEQVTCDVVNNLDTEKYDITVKTFWYGGYCQSKVINKVKVQPFFGKKYIRGSIRLIEILPARMLHRLFIREKYDIEIAASDGGAAKVISGSPNRKSKKICWVHMDVLRRGSKLKEFSTRESAQRIYRKFDIIAPVSKACMDSFIQKFGEDYPYSVKRNPIPEDVIIEKSCEEVPIHFENKINFVCVGRLEEQKGFDRLIEACHSLKRSTLKQLHVYILGDGSEKTQLSSLIHQYDLSETITFLGFQENPYPYIKKATVFLLPSRDEAFSIVVGESILLHTPVVATDCCGISEWLDGENCGMIVENSTEGIRKGMEKIMNNPKIVDIYRANIKHAADKICFKQAIDEFEELLNG